MVSALIINNCHNLPNHIDHCHLFTHPIHELNTKFSITIIALLLHKKTTVYGTKYLLASPINQNILVSIYFNSSASSSPDLLPNTSYTPKTQVEIRDFPKRLFNQYIPLKYAPTHISPPSFLFTFVSCSSALCPSLSHSEPISHSLTQPARNLSLSPL